MAHILQQNDITFEIIDNSTAAVGCEIENVITRKPEVLNDKKYTDMPVVLAAGAWQEMLEQINRDFTHIKTVLWMPELYYNKYINDYCKKDSE